MKKNYTISLEIDLQQEFKRSCLNKNSSISERLGILIDQDLHAEGDRLSSVECKIKELGDTLEGVLSIIKTAKPEGSF